MNLLQEKTVQIIWWHSNNCRCDLLLEVCPTLPVTNVQNIWWHNNNCRCDLVLEVCPTLPVTNSSWYHLWSGKQSYYIFKHTLNTVSHTL